MVRKKDRHEPGEIFKSIRKPVAPAAKKIGEQRPEEQVHPVQRKAKHKKKVDLADPDVQ